MKLNNLTKNLSSHFNYRDKIQKADNCSKVQALSSTRVDQDGMTIIINASSKSLVLDEELTWKAQLTSHMNSLYSWTLGQILILLGFNKRKY